MTPRAPMLRHLSPTINTMKGGNFWHNSLILSPKYLALYPKIECKNFNLVFTKKESGSQKILLVRNSQFSPNTANIQHTVMLNECEPLT